MFNIYVDRFYFTMNEAGITPKTLAEYSQHSDSPYVAQLVSFISKRYADNWVIYTDVEHIAGTPTEEPTANPDKIAKWGIKFGYIVDSTFDRYSKMLELYEQQKDKLFNKVGSTTTVKFNDTPQEQNIASDGYTTTTTTNTSEVDPGETITRLKNIDDNFKDIYKDWTKEFAPLFGDEV